MLSLDSNMPILRVLDEIFQIGKSATGNTVGLEFRYVALSVALQHVLTDQLVNFRAVGDPLAVCSEAFLVRQVRPLKHPLTKEAPFAIALDGEEEHLAIGAGEAP